MKEEREREGERKRETEGEEERETEREREREREREIERDREICSLCCTLNTVLYTLNSLVFRKC